MSTNDRNQPMTTESTEWAHWLEGQDSTGKPDGPPSAMPDTSEGDDCLRVLDAVAAVDYLRRGHRSGLTLWDALAEALRWWVEEQALWTAGAPDPDLEDAGSDPLGQALQRFAVALDDSDVPDASAALDQALRRWTTAMAERFNAGHHWPHPVSRQTFPPPVQAAEAMQP